MDPIRFGYRGRSGEVVHANPRDDPHPRFVPKTGQRVPARLTKRRIEAHLRGEQHHYLVNRVESVTKSRRLPLRQHLVALDIDGEDFHPARELAALVQLECFADFPTLGLPSTSGRGVHLWLVVERHPRTSPAKFNALLGAVSQELRRRFPRREGDAAWIDGIKGTLGFDAPNPAFDTAEASRMGGWRRAWRDDPSERIVAGTGEWKPAPASHTPEMYADSRRVLRQEGTLMVWTGAVEMTEGEAYERSKTYPGPNGFRLNERLERLVRHSGALVALPCAGRPDLVPTFCRWYDEVIDRPISHSHLKALLSVEAGPGSPGSHSVSIPSPPLQPAVELDGVGKPNRAWLMLTDGKDKLEAMMGTALIACQRHGRHTTVEDVLRIYEAAGRATGDRTTRRVRRAKGALKIALSSYDSGFERGLPKSVQGSETGPPARPGPPSFNEGDVEVALAWLQAELPDLGPLQPPARPSGRQDRVTHRHLAVVMLLMARYASGNAEGQVAMKSLLRSVTRNGLSFDGTRARLCIEALVGMGLLTCTDASYSYAKGRPRRARTYALGVRVPPLAWFNALQTWTAENPMDSSSPAGEAEAATAGATAGEAPHAGP